jgi:DNA-binding response OmpR family regulator
MSKPKLLLIEDNQHIQRIFTKKFQVDGFDVTTAASGEVALPLLQRSRPVAIVLDIMLPGIDGFEILRQLKSDARYQDIPVFMLSNKAWPDDVNLAFSLGAKSFHTKGSASPQAIVADIRRACDLKQVMLVSNSSESTEALVQRLQHPRLLCAVNHVLAEALSVIQRGTPDVILLDAVSMGSMFHVILQQLKTATATQSLPVVAVTMESPKVQRADIYVTQSQLDDILRPTVLQMAGISELESAPSPARVLV